MGHHHAPKDLASRWAPAQYANSFYTSRRNRSWLYRPELLARVPPAIVDRAGFVCWTGGDGWSEARNPHFGVEFVVSSDAFFEQGGRTHVVKAHSAYIVHRGQASSFRPGPSGHLHKRYIYLTGSLLDMLIQSYGLDAVDVVPMGGERWFAGYFRRVSVAMSMSGQEPHKTKALALLAFELMTELSHCLSEAQLPPQVRSAMEFLSRNLTRRPSLEELAQHSGVSLFHLLRLFRTSAGLSPMRFHAQRRMAYARNLLNETDLSIKEIAVTLGFSDPFNFTAQFRKHFGMSPRRFRQSGTRPG